MSEVTVTTEAQSPLVVMGCRLVGIRRVELAAVHLRRDAPACPAEHARVLGKRVAFGQAHNAGHQTAEVARLVGYASPSPFNKAFKRWTGHSPSAYRKQVLGAG